MQALSENVNTMLQVSEDSISVSDPEAVPEVWLGLTVLHEQTLHIKVGLGRHAHASGRCGSLNFCMLLLPCARYMDSDTWAHLLDTAKYYLLASMNGISLLDEKETPIKISYFETLDEAYCCGWQRMVHRDKT